MRNGRRMAHFVTLYEAKTHVSGLVDRAASGEEIVIAKNGVPQAPRACTSWRPAASRCTWPASACIEFFHWKVRPVPPDASP